MRQFKNTLEKIQNWPDPTDIGYGKWPMTDVRERDYRWSQAYEDSNGNLIVAGSVWDNPTSKTLCLPIYDDFSRPDTQSGDIGISKSGSTWVLLGNGYLAASPVGKVENGTFTAPEGSVVYASTLAPHNITKIGFKVSFVPGTGLGNNSPAFAVTPDNTIDNLGIHFFTTINGWALQTRTSGVFANVASGTYPTPLAMDGTVYDFEVCLDGDTATVKSAGMQAFGRSDAFITLAGAYVYFEHYYASATTASISTIHSVWAGTADPIITPKSIMVATGSEKLSSWADTSFAWNTLSSSGGDITSAVNTSGTTQIAGSNALNLTVGKRYKLVATLTLNSGSAPRIYTSTAVTGSHGSIGTPAGATITLSAGANTVYFTALTTDLYLYYRTDAPSNSECTFSLTEVALSIDGDIESGGYTFYPVRGTPSSGDVITWNSDGYAEWVSP